jgi:hypothetical protein
MEYNKMDNNYEYVKDVLTNSYSGYCAERKLALLCARYFYDKDIIYDLGQFALRHIQNTDVIDRVATLIENLIELPISKNDRNAELFFNLYCTAVGTKCFHDITVLLQKYANHGDQRVIAKLLHDLVHLDIFDKSYMLSALGVIAKDTDDKRVLEFLLHDFPVLEDCDIDWIDAIDSVYVCNRNVMPKLLHLPITRTTAHALARICNRGDWRVFMTIVDNIYKLHVFDLHILRLVLRDDQRNKAVSILLERMHQIPANIHFYINAISYICERGDTRVILEFMRLTDDKRANVQDVIHSALARVAQPFDDMVIDKLQSVGALMQVSKLLTSVKSSTADEHCVQVRTSITSRSKNNFEDVDIITNGTIDINLSIFLSKTFRKEFTSELRDKIMNKLLNGNYVNRSSVYALLASISSRADPHALAVLLQDLEDEDNCYLAVKYLGSIAPIGDQRIIDKVLKTIINVRPTPIIPIQHSITTLQKICTIEQKRNICAELVIYVRNHQDLIQWTYVEEWVTELIKFFVSCNYVENLLVYCYHEGTIVEFALQVLVEQLKQKPDFKLSEQGRDLVRDMNNTVSKLLTVWYNIREKICY